MRAGASVAVTFRRTNFVTVPVKVTLGRMLLTKTSDLLNRITWVYLTVRMSLAFILKDSNDEKTVNKNKIKEWSFCVMIIRASSEVVVFLLDNLCAGAYKHEKINFYL